MATKRPTSHAICASCLVDYNNDHASCSVATVLDLSLDCILSGRDSYSSTRQLEADALDSDIAPRGRTLLAYWSLYLSEARHSQPSLAGHL